MIPPPRQNEPVMAPTTPHDDFLLDARRRMVDSQLRPNKVTDPRILHAMRHLPRERFLPDSQRALAYADQTVTLGGGRVLPQPMVLARLVQAAAPLPGETALVVGAGSGYSAALLAACGCVVTALEQPGPLFDLARQALIVVAPDVTLVSGPLQAGWPDGAPYDLILIDGAVPEVPAAIAAQLKRDIGRLITTINEGDRTGHAVIAEPTPVGVSVRALFDCVSPVLPGFAPAPEFEF
jgi:protein-L-isoaspartate(D-aspartate) O-methyltransferase